jgi:CRP-like cAMP-binding protein
MDGLSNDNNKISWKSGTTIYKFDDQSDFAYFLIDGEIEIISENGNTVGYINQKEVFGEQSILLDTNRTVTAKASKDSVALKIPKDSLLKEFKDCSTLIKAILRSTCIRLTNLDNIIKTNLNSDNKN